MLSVDAGGKICGEPSEFFFLNSFSTEGEGCREEVILDAGWEKIYRSLLGKENNPMEQRLGPEDRSRDSGITVRGTAKIQ